MPTQKNLAEQRRDTWAAPLVPQSAIFLRDCPNQQPRSSTRGERNSTPGVNPHNENPTLIALGKLTRTNPRATLSEE